MTAALKHLLRAALPAESIAFSSPPADPEAHV